MLQHVGLCSPESLLLLTGWVDCLQEEAPMALRDTNLWIPRRTHFWLAAPIPSLCRQLQRHIALQTNILGFEIFSRGIFYGCPKTLSRRDGVVLLLALLYSHRSHWSSIWSSYTLLPASPQIQWLVLGHSPVDHVRECLPLTQVFISLSIYFLPCCLRPVMRPCSVFLLLLEKRLMLHIPRDRG